MKQMSFSKRFFLAFLFILSHTYQVLAQVPIERGRTVTLDFELRVGGVLIDSAKKSGYLTYRHGSGEMLPALERELIGLEKGDRRSVMLNPQEAYGLVKPGAFQEIPRTAFPKDAILAPGRLMWLPGRDGISMPVLISEVRKDRVIVNMNHPLAGKDLDYTITVIDVR